MPIYSTSTVNTVGGTNTGSIVINISDSIGGGDPVTYTFDVGVSLQSANYTFTGGNPAASSTFGNNGARWDDQEYSTGDPPTSVTYNWSRSVATSTDYVVVIMAADGSMNTHWGHISGPLGSISGPLSVSSADSASADAIREVDVPRAKLPKTLPRPPKDKRPTRRGMPR